MIDIVEIKKAVQSGQLEVFIANGNLYLEDHESGEVIKLKEGER